MKNIDPQIPTPPADEAADPTRIRDALRHVIRRSSRRWKRLVLFEAAGLAVAIPLAWLWIVFALDNLLHLPAAMRLAAGTLFVLAAGWRVVGLLRRVRQARFTEDQVALAIEHETPDGIENRLINSLQIPRETPAQSVGAFSDALLRENYQRLRNAELHQAATSRRALVVAAAALMVTAVGVGFWRFRRDHFTNAATRLLMPFADVAPMYRTVLTVLPGHTNAVPGSDVTLRILIEGQRPDVLSVIRMEDGRRQVETVTVEPGRDSVAYRFRHLERSLTYAVRGGDFTTPWYTLTVLTPPRLHRVRTVYTYPAYTGKQPETVESAGGDIEGLFGTRADVLYTLDQPVDEAVLLIETLAPPGTDAADVVRHPLTHRGATEFTVGFELRDQRGYRIETRRAARDPDIGPRHAVRVFADQPPRLRLGGLDRSAEIMLDTALSLTVQATDDYGLLEVGLFARRVAEPDTGSTPDSDVSDWDPIRVWPVDDGAREFRTSLALLPSALAAVEGETIEIALRARDTDPLRQGAWVDGEPHVVRFGGDEAGLQARYEAILRAGSGLQHLIEGQREAIRLAAAVIQSLEPGSGTRWDDAAVLEGLATAMREQAVGQERLRQAAAATAREMPAAAGNLRLAIGMLADTEMLRAVRILESVAGRDSPPRKRAALADARLTMERTVRSLEDMAERFDAFRRDWELAHMIPFVGMLVERQTALGREAESYQALPEGFEDAPLRRAAGRRQQTVQRLGGLAATAFAGLSEWIAPNDAFMAQAFATAADGLAADGLRAAWSAAADDLEAGRWSAATVHQAVAVETLAQVHLQLRQALAEAARRALEAHQDFIEGDLALQRDIEQLKDGSALSPLVDAAGRNIMAELIHMQESAEEQRKQADGEQEYAAGADYSFEEWMRSRLHAPGDGKYATLEDFHLASTPSGEVAPAPSFSDLPPTEVRPFLQETFEDLVGELLDEADLLEEQYMTYNLITAASFAEPGHPGKGGYEAGRTSASAPTGNEKPPTAHIGGASRSGRQGARSHGMTVGDESINRRGRDEVQEGQQVVPDQEGLMANIESDDPQTDVSTGIGGKRVDADDTHFSQADAGEWSDDMVDRLVDPQEKHNIVERQGKPLDHQVADLMRDLTATQRQVIERLKTIRKELTNIYLPTDHIDDLIARQEAALARLSEAPGPDVFRMQTEALDLLRGTVVVFHGVHSGHFPSVPRDQILRGRVLDEPPWLPVPGYETAVQRYFEKLAIP